jgi:hypothetical protein
MNINTFPYYDDFVANKKFYEILFKPGYSVQARELTQLQTMLQNQIKKFGDTIYKQGSIITGCAESHNFKTPYVKIEDIDTSVYPLSYYEGMTVTAPNGVSAIIKKTFAGTEAQNPNLNTLYLHYTSNNVTDPDPLLVNTISIFSAFDVLTVTGNNSGVSSFKVTGVAPTGEGSLFSLNDGIVYVNGRFLVHSNQTIIVDRYSSTPTQKIGFRVVEEIVTSVDDATLNDPAQGAYNFNAPGADRYKIVTELVSYGVLDQKPTDFFLLFEVEAGAIKRRYDKTQYSELSREFATRTYDESGDYTVRPFPIIVNEHLLKGTNHGKYTNSTSPVGDASKLVVGVEPGKAYVRGYEQELFSSEFLEISKSLDADILQNQAISTFFGNYILVNNVVGSWRLNTDTKVSIRNASCGGSYPTPSVGGSEIGTARIRNIQYDNGTIGTAGAVYRLYLHDVVFTSGGVASIGSFFLDETNDSFANVSGTPAFIDTKFVAPIFSLTHKSVKTLSDSSYVYKKTFSEQAVDGTGKLSVTLSGDEEWAFSAVSDTILDENLRVTLVQAGTGLGATGKTFDLATAFVTRVDAQTLDIDLNASTGGSPTVDVMVTVRKNAATCNQKTLKTSRYVKIQASGEGPFCLGLHDVISIEKIWAAPSGTAYPTSDPPIDDPDWNDVTSWFDLNNGQTDTVYDLASIAKNNAETITGLWLIVKLDFFYHSSSSGFYSVKSYPLPVQGVAPSSSQIEWHDIPTYTTTSGITFSLRDVLDFRSTANNTSTPDPTTIALATINPSSTVTFGAGATSPSPSDTFITDITYNLSRIDRVILDSAGTFTTVTGIPSEHPITPRQADNAMTLAIVRIPAFPSLSPYYARQAGKPEYATTITFVDNSRFTMRDIGSIQRRVERLEKYASLSVLEQQAASMLIPDIGGNDRFKNGIMVDPLIGHNVGNVYNPDYACSIARGEARPFFNLDNVFMEFDDASSGVVRKSNDKTVVVQQPLIGSYSFVEGEAITCNGGGTATIRYFSLIVSNAEYRWLRVYLEEASGVITTGNVITGTNSGAIGTIPSVAPTVGSTVFPPMVTIPSDGTLVTLPYTHVVYTDGPYATKSRNCSSQILFSFEGSMELSPSSDEWPDTSVQPEILYNTNGISDNWVSMITAWGTQWENWKTLWQKFDSNIDQSSDGAIDPSILTTSQRQLRDGIALSLEESKTANVIPYMRSVVVTFTATRLKAYTTVFPFFDGVDVSAHCKMSSSDIYGTTIATDAFGSVTGQFRIPAQTFMSGSKNFILSDISSDPFSPSATTMAYASYTSSGDRVFDENTILSTQKPETTFDFQRTTQNTAVERQVTTSTSLSQTVDPIAQTFFVSNSDGGVVLTKIGVFFQTKSLVSPITLQLRETKNGYPTENIIPYSTVTLLPEEVNTSEDGSGVTEFVFPSPVYLKNNTEYAFVLLPTGNDTGYNVWVGELGQLEIGTTNIIDKQPNAGILYVSGNNRTWTQFINEDMKFVAFAANFTGTGTIILRNSPIEYMTFSNMSDVFYPGDVIIGSGAGVGTGTIQYFNYETNEAQVLLTSGYFDASDAITCTRSILLPDLTATTTQNVKAVDAISPTLSYLDFNNTNIDWSYMLYKYDETPFSSYSGLAVNGTTEFLVPMAVFSHSKFNVSFMMEATLTTDAANISPIVDLEKVGCVIIGNSINNDTTGETGNGGSALSRYISRTVILDDGQEAEDLRVYLSSYTPSGSSIAVYAKLLNSTDNVFFGDRPWTPMTEHVVSGTGDFSEKYYTLPDTGSTSEAGGLSSYVYKYTTDTVLYTGFKTFAIKIVFLSSDTTRVPKVRDMRTIALQA